MIRTRIAPSPTGEDLHVGSIATALINYAWAKKHHGQFIVRIEDTDRTRLVPGAEEKILKSLNRVGLIPDESPLLGGPYGPYRQSERLPIYQKYAQELVDKGYGYYCICPPERLSQMRKEQQAKKQIPKYDRLCLKNQEEVIKKIKKGEKYVIRLKVPDNQEIIVDDLIRGKVKFNTKDIDDQVLLKSDGFPTYHLGVVVDDHLMKITHVIRGEEWLPSTPKHVLLYQAFGWNLPFFAHISLLRNPDKSKLSKRKNPVWASYYLDKLGIFSEALINYLALMGWSHPEEKDVFSLEEYIKVFDIKDIQKTAPIFDSVKLEWLNGVYIRKTEDIKLKNKILEFYQKENIQLDSNLVEKTIPLIKERIKKLSDYWEYCQFFFEKPNTQEQSLLKDSPYIKEIYQELEKITDWKADIIGERMIQLAKKIGVKNSDLFMMLRLAITGKKISPPLNESMEILGKEESLKRLKNYQK